MFLTIMYKEIKENFIAMKGLLWLFIVALLFSGMTYSFITVKELSLLAQTEVMLTMGKLILGVALLISIVLASVSFSNEKEQSTVESLLLTPVTGTKLAIGKLSGVIFMWLMVFALSIPYLLVLSYGTKIALSMILAILLIGTAIVFIYSAIAMCLSILMGNSKNAMVTSIVLFLITAIPAFLSTSIKKVGFGKILEKLSPLSNVTNMLKGIIINRQDVFSLTEFLVPLVIYTILSAIILKVAITKFNFEGGE